MPVSAGLPVALALGVLGAQAPPEPVVLTVKLVKERAGRCTAAPSLEFPAEPGAWRVVTKPYHGGENDWEVVFEIKTDRAKPPLSEAVLRAPGVKAARVIVGKTDVRFAPEGDAVRFRLVDDRGRGQLMQVVYRSPRGGYPIYFMHNWEMRRAEGYAKDPYPAKPLAAVKNYLLAAQEVLRRMGDMGPGERAFRGELVLMDCEVAATRGHHDFPPHVHLMHYQFEENPNGGRDWVSRLVPHLSMDAEGRFERNSYAVIAGRGKSGDLGPGDVCRFEDTRGTHVLDLIIAREGLLLRRPDGETWSLHPDPERGASAAVWGYRGDQPVCRAEARDDAEKGVFRYRLESYEAGKVVESFEDGYRYDPFTAKVLGK